VPASATAQPPDTELGDDDVDDELGDDYEVDELEWT
jgi:hypothetical protein